jgi:hypothetical protein
MIKNIEKIIHNNLQLIAARQSQININADHEGKRLLNIETKPFYRKTSNLTEKDIEEIVINSSAIINRMSEFKNCGWDIYELKAQLKNGINYYNENKKITNTTFQPSSIKKSIIVNSLNKKYPAEIKTLDGHFVRSKSEMIIDNFLYINNIVHAYERKLPIIENVYCDFYIPASKGRPKGVYIEYWGIESNPKYLTRKIEKLKIYKKYQLQLIELIDDEMQNIEEILTQKLISFDINVY